jgi:hypothetical protein
MTYTIYKEFFESGAPSHLETRKNKTRAEAEVGTGASNAESDGACPATLAIDSTLFGQGLMACFALVVAFKWQPANRTNRPYLGRQVSSLPSIPAFIWPNQAGAIQLRS